MNDIIRKVNALHDAGFKPVRINMSHDLHKELAENQTVILSGRKVAIQSYANIPVSILPAPDGSKYFTIEV